MTVELCLESYGAVAGSIDAGVMKSLFDVRPFFRNWTVVARRDESRPELDELVFEAADELPFDQAEALWLVDLCGYSYDEAAVATQSSRQVVANRVAIARQTIRHGVAAGKS